MQTLRWFIFVAIVGIPLTVTAASALTCVRASSAYAWCDDGTWVTDYSSRMRSVTGPGAETGLQGYPIPSGGRADGVESWGTIAHAPSWGSPPAPVSAPPSWWQPGTLDRSRDGGCARLQGRTVCW